MVEVVNFSKVPLEIFQSELFNDILRFHAEAENLVYRVRRQVPELAGLKCESRYTLTWRVETSQEVFSIFDELATCHPLHVLVYDDKRDLVDAGGRKL